MLKHFTGAHIKYANANSAFNIVRIEHIKHPDECLKYKSVEYNEWKRNFNINWEFIYFKTLFRKSHRNNSLQDVEFELINFMGNIL